MGNVISCSIGADTLLDRCYDCTAGQMNLGCNLDENIDTLIDEIKLLGAKKNDVINRVACEEGPAMKRLEEVAYWIFKVTNLEENIKDLILSCTKEILYARAAGCCAKISCRRRKLDKKVAQKLGEVANLKNREFASVVCGVAPDPRPIRNTEPTFGLKTSTDKVLEHIKNDEVKIIGLYGMGGVGKTTLLTAINNKLSDGTHGFDVVIWVSLSDNSSTENIQHVIGRKIGYSAPWEKKSPVEKADDITTVLSRKNFVLLLDDLRTEFKFDEVGIPLSSTRSMSKIIFTSRWLEVGPQREDKVEVNVKCLEKIDAWELFRSKVGDDTINRHPRVLKLAKLVAEECDGLPLALIIVGKAMATKRTPEEWSSWLSMLKMNAARFAGLEEKVFSILRLSYDNLPTNTVRSCFLYCSLFPGDFHIPRRKLINYWFGEGFVEDPDVSYHKIGDYLEGYSIIDTLVNASLLEDDENGGVKMHNVIRDMALWLACDCGKTIGKVLAQARAGLTEVPSDIRYQEVERLSLASNYIESLPQELKCSRLLTLLLNDNILNMISPTIFWYTMNLRVLDLSGNEGITELPDDIGNSGTGITRLQYLNLAGTGITRLPKSIGRMRSLKFLDLTHTRNLRDISPLQYYTYENFRVLKMFGSGLPISSKNVSLILYLLKPGAALISITIRMSTVLEKYIDRNRPYSFMDDTCIYRLGFTHMVELSYDLVVFTTRLAKTERLEITDCVFNKTPRPYTGNDLTKLVWNLGWVFIVRCSNVQNLTWLSSVESLKFLLVAHCKDIQEILGNENVSNPFHSLEEMYLIDLPELHSVSSADIKFQSLRYIGVEACPKLMNVSVNPEADAFTIQGSADWWDVLPEKPAASNWITPELNKEDKKKENYKSSSSASASTSTSTPYPDTHLPYFFSYD